MFRTLTPLNRKLEAKFSVASFVFRYETFYKARDGLKRVKPDSLELL